MRPDWLEESCAEIKRQEAFAEQERRAEEQLRRDEAVQAYEQAEAARVARLHELRRGPLWRSVRDTIDTDIQDREGEFRRLQSVMESLKVRELLIDLIDPENGVLPPGHELLYKEYPNIPPALADEEVDDIVKRLQKKGKDVSGYLLEEGERRTGEYQRGEAPFGLAYGLGRVSHNGYGYTQSSFAIGISERAGGKPRPAPGGGLISGGTFLFFEMGSKFYPHGQKPEPDLVMNEYGFRYHPDFIVDDAEKYRRDRPARERNEARYRGYENAKASREKRIREGNSRWSDSSPVDYSYWGSAPPPEPKLPQFDPVQRLHLPIDYSGYGTSWGIIGYVDDLDPLEFSAGEESRNLVKLAIARWTLNLPVEATQPLNPPQYVPPVSEAPIQEPSFLLSRAFTWAKADWARFKAEKRERDTYRSGYTGHDR